MCENDYGQLLEEYREMIESLFTLILNRAEHSNRELTKLKLEREWRKNQIEIESMARPAKKGD